MLFNGWASVYLYLLKPVNIFMARSRVFKSCLAANPCFHLFVHFNCVPIYMFDFHHEQCASTFVKFTSQTFSRTEESLKHKTRLLLLWDVSLVTLLIFMFINITSVVKTVHIFMARSRASKSCLMAELCFHRFAFWLCSSIYMVQIDYL